MEQDKERTRVTCEEGLDITPPYYIPIEKRPQPSNGGEGLAVFALLLSVLSLILAITL